MIKNSFLRNLLLGGLVWMMASCHSSYEITKVEGTRFPIDATLDASPDSEAVALLSPYKAYVDSVMYNVIGEAELSMDRERPESALSNLVADVLRDAATLVKGRPADVAVINIGGIRNSLTVGPVTTANVFEILPFENSLCVITMKGSVLRRLFENIAARGGEGISGAKLVISIGGELIQATVGGKPIVDGKEYIVSTVDYLADANDDLDAFLDADSRECPAGATMRGIFMEYVKKQTAAGKKLTSKKEGRITVK